MSNLVTTIPSSCPREDAADLQRLFPSRFILDSNSSASDESKTKSTDSKFVALHDSSQQCDVKNDPTIVFLYFGGKIFTKNEAEETLNIPSATFLSNTDEMKRVAVQGAAIHGLSLVKLTDSAMTIKFKGGSTILLVLQNEYPSMFEKLCFQTTINQEGQDCLKSIGEGNDSISEIMYDVNFDDSTGSCTYDEQMSVGMNSIASVLQDTLPPPKFPTLVAETLDGQSIEINSRQGIPLENDFFVGKFLVVVRPPNPADDPHYNKQIFCKKKRSFEIKFQGKLKFKPVNTIYCALEVTERMRIGIASRGVCNILLKLLSKINSDLHYSFGDKDDKEYGHISFPIYSFACSFLETKPDESPPPIEQDFLESQESKEIRSKSREDFDWKIGHTYSISFHSMYLDFPNWQLINLPMMPNMNLSTFWGQAGLRVALYEKNGSSNKHLKKLNKYLAGLQLTRIDDDEKDEFDLKIDPTKNASNSNNENNVTEQTFKPSFSFFSENKMRINSIQNDDDTDNFVDASTQHSLLMESDFELEQYYDASSKHYLRDSQSIEPIGQIEEYMNNICSGWIEMSGSNKKASIMFIFSLGKDRGTIFRSSATFVQHFSFILQKSRDVIFNDRQSDLEQNRQVMNSTLLKVEKSEDAKIKSAYERFVSRERHDDTFLQGKRLQNLSKSKSKDAVKTDCFVARFLNERHLIEEWATISEKYVSFYSVEKKKRSFRIPKKCIIAVNRSQHKRGPFLDFYILEIETVGRTTYVLFLTEELRNEWLKELSIDKQLDTNTKLTSNFTAESDEVITVDDPSSEFLHKSTLWRSKKRRILNCRKYFQDNFLETDQDASSKKQNDPCQIAKKALSLVLQLQEDNGNIPKLVEFLNIVSELKFTKISGLTENSKKAFFLNLYHLIVSHAYLVLGFPTSTYSLISFISTMCYQCADDIFSIKELEHCIIRAEGVSPSNFASKFILPKHTYEFALKEKDYRFNFALNCGSVSIPNAVPIYDEESIDEQLNLASRRFLEETVVIEKSEKKGLTIKLPRVCSWYLEDFGETQNELLKNIQDYLNSEDKKLLIQSLEDSSNITVKPLPFKFVCRNLTLLSS